MDNALTYQRIAPPSRFGKGAGGLGKRGRTGGETGARGEGEWGMYGERSGQSAKSSWMLPSGSAKKAARCPQGIVAGGWMGVAPSAVISA